MAREIETRKPYLVGDCDYGKAAILHHWVQAGCKYSDAKNFSAFTFLGTIKKKRPLHQSKKRQRMIRKMYYFG